MGERIFLIDGTALIYRSHFAFMRAPLTTSAGQNVSAVFGFAQTLLTVLRGESARYAAVALDTAAPTFRHERYEAYKAQRPPMPDELVAQLPLVDELIDALGLPVLRREGVEADDLIASLAAEAAAAGYEAVIVSADKDFNQIVRPGVVQYIPARGKESAVWLGPAEVAERWGVNPEQVLDVLALAGDAVDNVPGVRGIGEKTAVDLIRRFGGLDALYDSLSAVERASVREKLAAHRDDAFLSRDLIRLRCDLMPGASIESYRVPAIGSRPALLDLLQRLEFRRLIEGLDLRPSAGQWESDYRLLDDEEALREAIDARPPGATAISIDTETDSLDARTARAVGVSFAWEQGRAFYVPIGHREGKNLDPARMSAILQPILADPQIEKIGQNMKFDLHVLAGIGIRVEPPLFDTLLASYLLDPDRRHDLDSLTLEMLGHRKIPTKDLIGSGRNQTTMDLLRPEAVREYAAEDADAALRLRSVLGPALRERGQEDLLRSIEAPLIPVLVSMERTGVYIDTEKLRSLGREMEEDQRRQLEEITRLAGVEFNVNSPQQLGQVLFERLKLPKGKKTKTGYSTDSEVLEELALEQPIARSVLAYRQTAKLRSTYVEALPRLVDPQTGRLHAQFNQTVAATGRLSSSDPNLQNIPVRTDQGRRIRAAFVPQRLGDRLISADYSQIELRLLAHLSQDPGLVEAFLAGEDIHAATAARIFDLPPGQIDPATRARAKTVNFGVLYGMGPIRLSREMGIPLGEARKFIDQYFAKMPGVRRYLDAGLEAARRDGFVTTILGRRRYLPAIRSSDPRMRAQAERIAANTPIQGSAADLIKAAMIRVDRILTDRRLRTRLILQVHDELLFEGPADEREEVVALVREAMECAVDLSVPLKVDVGSGSSWDEAHA